MKLRPEPPGDGTGQWPWNVLPSWSGADQGWFIVSGEGRAKDQASTLQEGRTGSARSPGQDMWPAKGLQSLRGCPRLGMHRAGLRPGQEGSAGWRGHAWTLPLLASGPAGLVRFLWEWFWWGSPAPSSFPAPEPLSGGSDVGGLREPAGVWGPGHLALQPGLGWPHFVFCPDVRPRLPGPWCRQHGGQKGWHRCPSPWYSGHRAPWQRHELPLDCDAGGFLGLGVPGPLEQHPDHPPPTSRLPRTVPASVLSLAPCKELFHTPSPEAAPAWPPSSSCGLGPHPVSQLEAAQLP